MKKPSFQNQLNDLLKKHKIELSKNLLQDLNQITNKFEQESLELYNKYDILYNNSNLAYQSLDMNGNIIEVNNTWLKTLGYKKSEVIGKWFGDFLRPDYIKIFKERFERFKKEGKVEDVRFHISKKNGSYLLVSYNGCILYNTDGEFKCTYCSFVDITKQEETLLKLSESEEKYRKLVDIQGEGIAIIDENEVFTFSNSAADNIFGVKKGQLVGRPILDFLSKEEQKKIRTETLKRKKGIKSNYELEIIRPDGKEKIINVTVVPELDKNGKYLSSFGIFRDITQQKKIEKELIENEEKFRTITNSAQDAIILMNEKGNVEFWNKAATNIFDFSEKEILGKNLHKFIVPEKYVNSYKKAFATFIETGTGKAVSQVLELTAKRKNGSEFPVELSLSALKLNNTWHSVGIIREITERKKNELDLKEKNHLLQELNATKDKFFSIIAHDLRGPVNNLVGFSGLLEKYHLQYDRDKLSHIVSLMSTAAKRTFNLLENLLLWAKSQRDKLLFKPQTHVCKELITEVLSEMEHLAFAKNIDLLIKKDNSELQVYVDKDMFNTVIRNLVSNALKYTDEGGQISIGCNKTDGNFIEFYVKDNGIGISKEDMNKLFRIDENITTEGTNRERGTGLGLILCKDFIEKHGGNIWVESKKNKGSTFWFTFPKSKKD